MAKKVEERQMVAVVLIIEIDGSYVQNRLTAFQMPIVALETGDSEAPGKVEFETRELKNAMIKAIRKM